MPSVWGRPMSDYRKRFDPKGLFGKPGWVVETDDGLEGSTRIVAVLNSESLADDLLELLNGD